MSKMKILQISHKPPLPAIDGGCIAVNNITRGLLKSGHQVKVLSMHTPKHPLQLSRIPEEYREKTAFESVFVNTRIRLGKALLSFLKNRSYHVSRFISKEFENTLVRILQSETFDIIQLESIFVAPYIPVIRRFSNAKVVLRSHNVEHKIWGRFLIHQKNVLKKILLLKMIRQLKEFELSVFPQTDGFLAISQPDYNYFHHIFPDLEGKVIPAGIDLEQYEMDLEYIPSSQPKLFHIGSMNWIPNLEGLEWFLDEVWGKVLEKMPFLTFTLAGRGIPKKWMQHQYPNVDIIGEVPDANKFMLSKDIMIVPLLSGSGVRIKILEGMALAKAIITTPIGAEGLGIENGKNIFIANTPQEFVDMIAKCVDSPDICKIIGQNAREYVTLHHNNEVITDDIVALYEKLSLK